MRYAKRCTGKVSKVISSITSSQRCMPSNHGCTPSHLYPTSQHDACTLIFDSSKLPRSTARHYGWARSVPTTVCNRNDCCTDAVNIQTPQDSLMATSHNTLHPDCEPEDVHDTRVYPATQTRFSVQLVCVSASVCIHGVWCLFLQYHERQPKKPSSHHLWFPNSIMARGVTQSTLSHSP